VYALLTQIVIPTIYGAKWFPIFNRQRKIERKIRQLYQEKLEQCLEQKSSEIEENLEAMKEKTKLKG
jgi:hypothetical protein